jgi:lipopolysaccharide transport protein LptA
MFRYRWTALVAALVAPAAGAGTGQDSAMEFGGGTNTTVITSKHLDFDYSRHTAVFDGNVVVADPRVKIMADQITAVFSTNNQPEIITAAGNVRIEQEARQALCERAVYSLRSGLLVLTGKPKVVQPGGVMSGSRIIFSRDDDRVKCEDSSLTIVPGQGSGFDDFIKPRK